MNQLDMEPVGLGGMASLMKADYYSAITEPDPSLEGQHVPMVTISRTYGTNGTEVGQRLAERLQVGFYDREVLNEVCRQTHSDRFLMENLYEKPVRKLDEVIYGILGKGGNVEMMRVLPGIISGIQRTGGVILGRGAHLLDTKLPIFRVRLDGSLPVCTRRVMQRLNLSETEARALIRTKNLERESFTRTVYKRFRSARQFYDMVINTDLFTTEQVVEMILSALRMKNFMLPREQEEGLIHTRGDGERSVAHG